NGDRVRVTSRRGSVKIPALITERVQGNVLFMSIHQGKPGLNHLTGDHHDPDVNTPAFKETAVRLEILPGPRGDDPLPAINFRHGRRTPNAGIDAELKWAQPGYYSPPQRQPNAEKL